MSKGWRVIDTVKAKEEWDAIIKEFPSYNLYQSYLWGEVQAANNWSPIWLVLSENNENVVAFQGLMKKNEAFKVIFILAQGGPLVKNVKKIELTDALKEVFRGYKIYLRITPLIDPQSILTHKDVIPGFKKVSRPMFGGLTIIVREMGSPEVIRNGFSKNWKRNLKRGLENNDHFIELFNQRDHDLSVLYSIYVDTNELKQVKSRMSYELFRNLLTQKDGVKLFIYKQPNGQIDSIRGYGFIGSKGYDLIAATTMAGRKNYSSYVLLWHLLNDAWNNGIREYDLSGVDPVNNEGVYNFKKGVGGEIVEYPSEYEWSSPNILKWVINGFLRIKDGHF